MEPAQLTEMTQCLCRFLCSLIGNWLFTRRIQIRWESICWNRWRALSHLLLRVVPIPEQVEHWRTRRILADLRFHTDFSPRCWSVFAPSIFIDDVSPETLAGQFLPHSHRWVLFPIPCPCQSWSIDGLSRNTGYLSITEQNPRLWDWKSFSHRTLGKRLQAGHRSRLMSSSDTEQVGFSGRCCEMRLCKLPNSWVLCQQQADSHISTYPTSQKLGPYLSVFLYFHAVVRDGNYERTHVEWSGRRKREISLLFSQGLPRSRVCIYTFDSLRIYK